LEGLTFASQNCNSLNISTHCPNQVKKISAILALQASIIFLSDLRLNSDKVKSENLFSPHYTLYSNSRQSKRGTGILIKNNLSHTVISEYHDNIGNIMGLLVKFDSNSLLILSVYGPNNNDESFFNTLRQILKENLEFPVVAGGDWNLTVCTDSNDKNIDTLNMVSPPSLFRSRLLAEICETHNLTDPYRALHPHRRDYTYIPRTGKKNRSRIDFFIISDSLLSKVKKCDISTSLETSLFDHKSIYLSFKENSKKPNNYIDPKIFKHCLFDAVVTIAVAETYLQHADPDGDLDVDTGLREVGFIIDKIREANDLEFDIYFEGRSQQKDYKLSGLYTEIKMLLEHIPSPDELNEFKLSCTNDLFFEVLLGNIRNALVSFQLWLRKIETCRISAIIKKINLLKTNYLDNQEEIFELEHTLCQLRDEGLAEKISNVKIFENLHNERPSPLFLNLIKCTNSDNLTLIKDDNGNSFPSTADRHSHIVDYFEKVYKKRKDADHVDYANCIRSFLGPTICESDIVKGSILTEDERQYLDSPLTLFELDKSIEAANMKSAPGLDGFSNVLIKKCWKFLRKPLLNYANHCFDTGVLTTNFRSAVIKLIPKKGDCSRLKNWRPISLLSNVYKILSRAITSRLNKYNNRICSRAQKGYNNQRYVQEVLINVCETIKYCRASGTRAGVIAVDMAKAFDTLDQRFIEQVYKFFGMGNNIIRWLQLFGNRRQACIALEDQIYSKHFDLECGRPQGDNLSPITFNFCEQILIFRLELDPLVSKIPRNNPRIINPSNPFLFEANRETDSNESLADDNTVITLMTPDSLGAVKNALDEFSVISGLCCNYDKTILLSVMEPTQEEEEMASNAGFRMVDSFKLLGMDITRDYRDIASNFVSIRDKIVNLTRYWERFRLSLPGRITIAKTFLVSQLNYLGSVFIPPSEILAEIQGIINSFIKKNLNISGDRIYFSACLGGLGFFNLSDFLEAQRCSWIFRAHKFPIDNWRYDLHSLAPNNNVLLLRASDVNENLHPVLHGIVKSYENFYYKFSSFESNAKNAFIFENKFFHRTEDVTATIDRNFFGQNLYANNVNFIRTLTYSDCFRDGHFLTVHEWQQAGFQITVNTWLRLRNAILDAKGRIIANNLCETVIAFCNKLKKGSKKIRKYYEHFHEKNKKIADMRFYTTFSTLISIRHPNEKFAGDWISVWKFNPLPNDLKQFIFHCRFNSLPLNNRLHSYLPDIDPRCTFCRLVNTDSQERDNFLHCFFSCIQIRHLLTSFLRDIKYDFTDNDDIKTLFWYGIQLNDEGDNVSKYKTLCYNVLFDSFRFVLFKFRQRNILPSYETLINHVRFIINNICRCNKKFRDQLCEMENLTILAPARG
jgi:exonuclease III